MTDDADVTNYLLIFAGVLVIDIVYTRYLHAIYQQQVIAACCWASTVTSISGMIIINYTSSLWSIVAAALGAFAGTYVSMKFRKQETA